jgi:hypothetical protein
MSRNLPDRPNLEFLKNEAKALLDSWQRTDPAAQLADAQHALAREYGFASWPKLKAHVDAVTARVRAAGSAERDGAHPLAGRWVADVAHSKRHPANQFQRAIINFAVNGDTVEIDDEYLDEAGAVIRNHNTIVADGAAHPTPNGFVVTATWRGLHALDFEATKNGEVVGRGQYAVSPDGHRLTISANEGDQVIVLDRAAALSQ